MCRILGCVAPEPVSLRHELLECQNPLIRQSEEHDSGWGLAAYRTTAGEPPQVIRFTQAAHESDPFAQATALEARIWNVHVRRATIGGLEVRNTHPFCMGNYSFSHNGTILDFPKLIGPGAVKPRGETDSEPFFNLMMSDFDPGAAIESLRRTITRVIALSPFSGLNFLLSDGERLYAYRLGAFELHWHRAADRLLVASERLDQHDAWHSVQQDVVLVLEPGDIEEPHAERLVGDAVLAGARIEVPKEGTGLRGAERGAFAAARATRLSAADAR
ncbi:MAG: hypothetical protein NVSMB25_09580 [Thermoleophilaceae bacterium]